ncbi:MAG: hypothetical protein CFE24_02250 [Flavobacterium sp. BFFFF2]|nr:MAG: hypothetical protein CFE24_02250 [Flavobacterium sp. BFFFF2]
MIPFCSVLNISTFKQKWDYTSLRLRDPILLRSEHAIKATQPRLRYLFIFLAAYKSKLLTL